MYKLTIVAGPNLGSSYVLQEDGNLSIGRHGDNVVVLPSARVSKHHCVLSVHENEILMKDQGSSNGTFINGILAKSKKLKIGDRISVGEYVFEISDPKTKPPRRAPDVAGFGNVIAMPIAGLKELPAGASEPGAPMQGAGAQFAAIDVANADTPPKDLKEKILWYFERQLMPVFYSLNLKYEWRLMVLGLLAALTLGNLFISVYPLIESGRLMVAKEASSRARFMARQIAEQNVQFVAAGASAKTEIGLAEDAEGVKLALLVDLDNRVLAPATKAGQFLTNGEEARFAVKMKELFNSGRETGHAAELDENTITAIEPVKVFNPRAGRNVIVAMAIVSIDTALVTLNTGEIGVIYSKTLIFTGVFALLIYAILHRLTLRPFRVLTEDLEKGLKGEIAQVTHEYKTEDTDQLWQLIDSALQRIPRTTTPNNSLEGNLLDSLTGPVRMMGELARFGLVLCDSDRKIVYLNPIFQEISGIREDSALGQTISAVARDQAFDVFATDIFDRLSANGTEPIAEDYEFEGIAYKVNAAAFTMPGGGQVKGFLITFLKTEG